MSDKRSVATDALDTLGTAPIDDQQKRDAIHLAVEPVTAGERMDPGDHVTITNGVAWRADEGDEDAPVGIVDPFVRRPIRKGERFWLVLYPRTIKSLRHVWSHPAFPDAPVVGASAAASPDVPVWTKEKSERWLREFCDRSDCPDYEYVIAAIENTILDEHSLHLGRDATGEIPPEFWDHVEIVLGRKVEHRPTYFSCSC